jgi:hypothetical protein
MFATRVWRLNLIDVMGMVAMFAFVFASVSKRWLSLWATYLFVASLFGFAVGGILLLVTLLLLRSAAAVTTGGRFGLENPESSTHPMLFVVGAAWRWAVGSFFGPPPGWRRWLCWLGGSIAFIFGVLYLVQCKWLWGFDTNSFATDQPSYPWREPDRWLNFNWTWMPTKPWPSYVLKTAAGCFILVFVWVNLISPQARGSPRSTSGQTSSNDAQRSLFPQLTKAIAWLFVFSPPWVRILLGWWLAELSVPFAYLLVYGASEMATRAGPSVSLGNYLCAMVLCLGAGLSVLSRGVYDTTRRYFSASTSVALTLPILAVHTVAFFKSSAYL